jgi:hypothetical protein
MHLRLTRDDYGGPPHSSEPPLDLLSTIFVSGAAHVQLVKYGEGVRAGELQWSGGPYMGRHMWNTGGRGGLS